MGTWHLCFWKQWGRSSYRELRKRGVSVREAWNTSKSAHGPWRVSQTPALSIALPLRFSSYLRPSGGGSTLCDGGPCHFWRAGLPGFP